MDIKYEGIFLDTDTYLLKLLNEYKATGSAPTPATKDLFNDPSRFWDLEILIGDDRKNIIDVLQSCHIRHKISCKSSSVRVKV